MFSSKKKRSSSSKTGASAPPGKSNFALRRDLSTLFIQKAQYKLYPEDNVHVYAYSASPANVTKQAEDLAKCTMLIDYSTGEVCEGVCKAKKETQKQENMLCKINRFSLLDTKLCMCRVPKSDKDKAYIVAFYNIPHDDVPALQIMCDFYQMMGGANDVPYWTDFAEDDDEPDADLLKACRKLADTLEATTFKKALERF